ncbi:hypothetical protein CMV_019207 [Castanea mollissima]|uniref:Signal peptidase complex catalytic subunit SEC11 n=1 Tax=Castanea mollissima TaxID=60419 RepID=A0A8J4VNX5_9ROSI|nr:hypothetical protein CMV_019207 [Castanea mollissima]
MHIRQSKPGVSMHLKTWEGRIQLNSPGSHGDVLIFHVSKDPICVGEIIAFKVDGINFLIANRVIEVHEQRNTGKVYILMKDSFGEPNAWGLSRVLPFCGWIAIIVNEKAIFKYIFIVTVGLQAMIDD